MTVIGAWRERPHDPVTLPVPWVIQGAKPPSNGQAPGFARSCVAPQRSWLCVLWPPCRYLSWGNAKAVRNHLNGSGSPALAILRRVRPIAASPASDTSSIPRTPHSSSGVDTCREGCDERKATQTAATHRRVEDGGARGLSSLKPTEKQHMHAYQRRRAG